eukprot:scaffold82176_cov118-Phaeocystis_antarctica.AAC.3
MTARLAAELFGIPRSSLAFAQELGSKAKDLGSRCHFTLSKPYSLRRPASSPCCLGTGLVLLSEPPRWCNDIAAAADGARPLATPPAAWHERLPVARRAVRDLQPMARAAAAVGAGARGRRRSRRRRRQLANPIGRGAAPELRPADPLHKYRYRNTQKVGYRD